MKYIFISQQLSIFFIQFSIINYGFSTWEKSCLNIGQKFLKLEFPDTYQIAFIKNRHFFNEFF